MALPSASKATPAECLLSSFFSFTRSTFVTVNGTEGEMEGEVMGLFVVVVYLFNGFGAFTPVNSTSGPTSYVFNRVAGHVATFVVFAGIRKRGCDDFCLFSRLFYPFRVVFSRSPIRQGRRWVGIQHFFFWVFGFYGRVSIYFSCLFFNEFFTPIPIIWVTNVRGAPVLRIGRR